ncbi:MAG: pyridoxamine 5'-phosphate oxidase family protein [Pseudomonadales bacterium]|nr:pyridoxamine 5'-phosphate oxidase family protein [Pseudomonadales bacterium]
MSLKMSIDEREAFLAGLHVGVISIPREGRAPLTAPIWYDYKPGGEAWVITDANSLKGKAIQKAPQISLCAQSEDMPYKYVTIEGSFTTRPSTQEELLSMAIRYLGEEQGKAYADNPEGDGESILVSISTERWLTVDYGKM